MKRGIGPFEALGEVLVDLRGERGLGAEELAHRSGIPKEMVAAIEAGREEPSLETLGVLLEAVGAGAGELGRRLDRARRRAQGATEPPAELLAAVEDIAEGMLGVLWYRLTEKTGTPGEEPPRELRALATAAAEGMVEFGWHGLKMAEGESRGVEIEGGAE